MVRRAAIAVVATVLVSLPATGTAEAAPACKHPPKVRVLYSGSGVLESIAVDRHGRVFFTDSTNGELLMLREGGRPPKLIADGIEGAGGIVFKRNGDLLVGFGNSIQQASDGEANPEAGLLRIDPDTGKSSVFVDGLQMANGIARGPGGQLFASVDVGMGIDRISGPDHHVELGWASLLSPNGLIADSSGKYLFANQTFTTAAIQRIPIADPAAAEPYFTAAPADISAGFDGLTRDGRDRLYVAANGAGQVWRVSGPNSACVLADRDPFPDGPSDLVFGRGRKGPPAGDLLVTTFGGELLQLRAVR
jgi:sugar lactone lactonase YvrE